MTYSHLRADCLYTGISSGPTFSVTSMGSLYLFFTMVAAPLHYQIITINIFVMIIISPTWLRAHIV